jgi:putative nucleotidyltransferase with HDIG domain
MDTMKKTSPRIGKPDRSIPAPLRIAMIYLIIGFLWIIISDVVILSIASDTMGLTVYQTAKGVVYVLITALVLYMLIFRDYSDIQASRQALEESYDATLRGWVSALDLRDHETEGHTTRVAELTLNLAHSMGISEEDLIHIRRGALLHDIGKMAVPDNILYKPGKLTEEEWQVIRQHPVHAYHFLSGIEHLQQAIVIPYCHHEKWDGSGYPRGLAGEEIPLAARIFAVVDVWDALSSDRPYRPAWPQDQVIAYLQAEKGKYFQPEIVDQFLALLAEEPDR